MSGILDPLFPPPPPVAWPWLTTTTTPPPTTTAATPSPSSTTAGSSQTLGTTPVSSPSAPPPPSPSQTTTSTSDASPSTPAAPASSNANSGQTGQLSQSSSSTTINYTARTVPESRSSTVTGSTSTIPATGGTPTPISPNNPGTSGNESGGSSSGGVSPTVLAVVVIGVLLGLVGCVWLLVWMRRKRHAPELIRKNRMVGDAPLGGAFFNKDGTLANSKFPPSTTYAPNMSYYANPNQNPSYLTNSAQFSDFSFDQSSEVIGSRWMNDNGAPRGWQPAGLGPGAYEPTMDVAGPRSVSDYSAYGAGPDSTFHDVKRASYRSSSTGAGPDLSGSLDDSVALQTRGPVALASKAVTAASTVSWRTTDTVVKSQSQSAIPSKAITETTVDSWRTTSTITKHYVDRSMIPPRSPSTTYSEDLQRNIPDEYFSKVFELGSQALSNTTSTRLAPPSTMSRATESGSVFLTPTSPESQKAPEMTWISQRASLGRPNHIALPDRSVRGLMERDG
ncbi:hypothetical protein HDU93_009019 [Gonapodya sp. JEL0774]|nr:hypothetical protein HDU93_009019 [Gonapodya sp. JEL0774]